MSLRDWLLIGGGILVLIVIFDGIRRMRQRGRLRLDIDSKLGDLPEPDLSSELPNGGARPARGRSEAGSSREPSISEPFVSERASPETRQRHTTAGRGRAQAFSASRQTRENEEIDLLLADDLQGVGQGADRWLSSQSHDPEQEQDPEPLHTHGARDPVGSDTAWSALDPFDDEGEEAVGRPRRARAAAPASSVDTAEPEAPAPDRRTEETAKGPGLTLTNRPSLAADELDLSKPVPELVEQMASRSRPQTEPASAPPAKGETASEPKTECKTESRAESRIEAVSELKVELKAEPVDLPAEAALGTAQPWTVVDPEPLTATRDTGGAPAVTPAPEMAEEVEPADRRGRKGRKKKGRRGLPEIQINIFDAHPELAPEPELTSQPSKAREAEQETRKKELQKQKDQKQKAQKQEPQQSQAPAAPRDPAEDVLVISVAARRDAFQGNRLFKLLAACDLTFGDMNIFHRHEEPGAKGPVQFSMANAVKPGTFDLSDPERFRTPAVTFFLNMAEPRELDNAFDCMLATAKCVAENLDGELKDENRSSLRPQTIEHCRQRIRDFKRRRLTRRA